jgi:hypothetical protein
MMQIGWLWAFVVLYGAAFNASGQLARAPAEIGWVGLYSRQLIEWLENENRLTELCKPVAGNVIEHDRCRAEKLQSRPFVVTLRRGPDASALAAGSLLLLATPGKGIRFFYLPTSSGAPREFDPDLNLQDWGYGPYFHQTYLERRGNWFLLPQDPFPAGTWLNARELDDEPHILEASGIVSSPMGSLVILAVEPDFVRARPEQPGDMWCKSGEPPTAKPSKELRIPRRDLYSPSGHLLIAPKYMKGC